MNILITGAAGFVGKYCIKKFSDNFEVFATKLSTECETIPTKWIDMDLLSIQDVENALKIAKPDLILHLAAQSSVSYSWKNPEATCEINIIGTLNLLDSIRKLNIFPIIILAGSSEEYGKPNKEVKYINEHSICLPENIYAVSKLCQNNIGRLYHEAYGLKTIMTRAFNHIGPGQSDRFVASDFAKQIARIEHGLQAPIIYTGNLASRRDFLDVRDVVSAYEKLFRFGKFGMTYNIGSGKAILISDLLEQLISFSNIDIKYIVDKNKCRPIDVPIIQADNTRLVEDTGWKPEIDINTTLKNTLDYWRQRVRKD